MAKKKSTTPPELESVATEDLAPPTELVESGQEMHEASPLEERQELAIEPQEPEDLAPPTADELFSGSPNVNDLLALGYEGPKAKAIYGAFQRMMTEVRDILRPGLIPEESVQIRSVAPKGHYRVGRKWNPTFVCFAPDDPFLSEKTMKALSEDPRIQIKMPK